MYSLDRWMHLQMYNIRQNQVQHHVLYRAQKCWVVCTHPALCRWACGFHLVLEGLTKALFSRPYNQTSHVSGERGEPWAACNDQHIPGLSGIPAVKSPAVCSDPQPRNTWKAFVWGWGSKQHHYNEVVHVLRLKHWPLLQFRLFWGNPWPRVLV